MIKQSLQIMLISAVAMGVNSVNASDFDLQFRAQVPDADQRTWRSVIHSESWNPQESAVIICDVWDAHHCWNAVRRLEEMLPRMNQVVSKLRDKGVTVIHAPSDCMEFYRNSPARLRAAQAPTFADEPLDLDAWCPVLPSEAQGDYPIEQWDGGEDDDPDAHQQWSNKLKSMGRNPSMPWISQADAITIDQDRDYISDRGSEVWRVLKARGIRNVLLVGVHANMCVLGRPFGLRKMVKNGFNTCLMRDMTDCMYNPSRWPFVSHLEGNLLLIDYVERHVCPTISSDQILGDGEFQFSDWRSPTDALVQAEYPSFSSTPLQWRTFTVSSDNETLQLDVERPRVVWLRCAVQCLGPREIWASASFQWNHAETNDSVWWDGTEQKSGDSLGEIDPNEVYWLVMKIDSTQQIRESKVQIQVPKLVASDGTAMDLHGRWEYCTYDGLDFSQPRLPAKFGASPSVVFILDRPR